ncbi:MAG: MoaD/ThiS family protein [Anaerolineales bacterium]|jgi:hypothetical protein|nr:MoaD/ThiS family protein [Anaerolineales bacterium]
MIRVILPTQLWRLANIGREVEFQLQPPVTYAALLQALEARYPALRGTIYDPVTHQRRPFIRFFANGEDWSHEPLDAELPPAVASGAEPLRIVGAMAGG